MPEFRFFAVAAMVGAIVSIDVLGLILSESEKFARGRKGERPVKRTALLHALWHGGLFIAYNVAILAGFRILENILELLQVALRPLWKLGVAILEPIYIWLQGGVSVAV